MPSAYAESDQAKLTASVLRPGDARENDATVNVAMVNGIGRKEIVLREAKGVVDQGAALEAPGGRAVRVVRWECRQVRRWIRCSIGSTAIAMVN